MVAIIIIGVILVVILGYFFITKFEKIDNKINLIVISLFLVFLFPTLAFSQISIERYIKEGGVGDGTTWQKASGNIQTILGLAANVDKLTVHVAAGTYKGSIQIASNTNLIGGYSEDGSWDPYENETILLATDDATNTVECSGTIQGFRIKPEGRIRGGVNLNNAAMYYCKISGFTKDTGVSGRGTIMSCEIYNNKIGADFGGVISDCNIHDNELGVDCYSDGVSIFNSIINNNHNTHKEGGGIYCDPTGKYRIEDCIITNNSCAARGGGICGGGMVISRCYIANNKSQEGSGIYLVVNTCVENSIIENNVSSNNTASVYLSSVDECFLRNCTLRNNTGGGVYYSISYGSNENNPNLLNCILWNNSGGEILNPKNYKLAIKNCAITGGFSIPEVDSYNHIINLSAENDGNDPNEIYPRFSVAETLGDILDFSLQANSILINKGKDVGFYYSDCTKEERKCLGGIDIGASEYQGIYTLAPATKIVPIKHSKGVINMALTYTTFAQTKYYKISYIDEGLVNPRKGIYLGSVYDSYSIENKGDLDEDGLDDLIVYYENKKAGSKNYCVIYSYSEKQFHNIKSIPYIQLKQPRPIVTKVLKESKTIAIKQGNQVTKYKL